jgi:hypothetical protein
MIKAKMHCHQVENGLSLDGVKMYEVLHAHPVYYSTEENKSFAEATPSGSLSLTISNPAAWGVIKSGDEFYLDFTPINKEYSNE